MTYVTRLLSIATIAALPGAALAAELVPVTYGANWMAQGEHGGFYQAIADGSYAECGLDVTIVAGGPQLNNRAQMLAGKIDFYMGTSLGALTAAEEGAPTVMVAALFQKEPQVLMTHPGKAKDFTDLKSLKLLVSSLSYATSYQWMMHRYGFTPEQRLVYTYNLGTFLNDEDTAVQGYVTSDPLVIERQAGWKPEVFLLADSGYDPYSTTIETMAATIAERPEVVQCFVDGSIKGWYNYIYGDSAPADAMIKAENPEMTDDLLAYARDQMKARGIVDSGDATEYGVGVITDERMRSFYDEMVAAGVLKEGLDFASAYTTQFIGKGVGLDLKPAQQ